VDLAVEEAIKDDCCTEFDLATILYQLYKDSFVCVDIRSARWFQYINQRWMITDSGTELRKHITSSKGLFGIFAEKARQTPMNPDDDRVQKKIKRILSITKSLKKHGDKIMHEAAHIFYVKNFMSLLDSKDHLLCFTNGVVDFHERRFRDGHPEDYTYKCTNIGYTPLNHLDQKVVNEVITFMNQLFPDKELCEYMWDHLASTLIGTAANQTFNMYIGIGQNGKSVLVNLMEMVLGDYKGDVPLTLVTEKRGKVGGLTPEIVELKGIRYAVMAEPQKGDKINEGMMKTLTSGKDRLQGRAPYMPQTISFLPQFKLVVTCNVFMEVKSNDHGTWRRIRAVPFKSLFTKNPVKDDKEKPFQFLLDEYIDEKFDSWKEVFAAMLVKRAFETGGMVKDCGIVLAKSNEYRQSQDYISEFTNDCVVRDPNGRIKKMELNSEFAIWYGSNYGGKCPGPKDLHEYMDKTFGKQRAGVWSGVKLKFNHEESDFAEPEFDGMGDDDDVELNEL
jgi:P4 family phage/plasmid primase-like protien